MATHLRSSEYLPSAYITPLLAAGLTLLTVFGMYVFAFTPLAQANDYLFASPIVGIIVYGTALMGGDTLSRRGLKNDRRPLALLGVAVLAITYSTFGGGIVADMPFDSRVPALIITGIITAAVTVAFSISVTQFNVDFSPCQRYAMILFGGGVLFGVIGSIVELLDSLGSVAMPILVLMFACFLTAFTFQLAHDVHKVHTDNDYGPYLMAVELYISVTGVFVHVLQLTPAGE